MPGVVERYLDAVVSHDWESLKGCLTDDVVRVGPFGDAYSPKGPYVEFLSQLMPSLQGYSMKIDRVLYNGDVAVAQLTETLEMGGKVIVTPEALVFDLTSDGLIRRIEIFIQRHGD